MRRLNSPDLGPHLLDSLSHRSDIDIGAEGPELEMEKVEPPTTDSTFSSHVWAPSDGRLFCATSSGDLWQVDPNTNKLMGEPTSVCADGSVCHLLSSNEHLICWTSAGALVWLALSSMAECYRVQIPLPPAATLVSACRGDEHVFLGSSDGSIYHVQVLQPVPVLPRDDADAQEPVTLAGPRG